MRNALSPTLQAFCEHEELLRLAYLDRQGFPRVVPLWFVLLDHAYYVGTGYDQRQVACHAARRTHRLGH